MKEEAVESVSYKQGVLPQKIRWLAIATGLVTAGALLSSYWPLSVLSILLIFAGIVQPRSPQLGRLVLSVVAPLMSVWVIPVGFVMFGKRSQENPAATICSSWLYRRLRCYRRYCFFGSTSRYSSRPEESGVNAETLRQRLRTAI